MRVLLYALTHKWQNLQTLITGWHGTKGDAYRVSDSAEQARVAPARVAKKPIGTIDNIHQTARRVIVWSAIFATAGLSLIGIYPIAYAYMTHGALIDATLEQHFAAIVGLPAIAALAFLIVITFEARFDAIEMEFFRIVKFKGAAGPGASF
jgi:hypothetical protein